MSRPRQRERPARLFELVERLGPTLVVVAVDADDAVGQTDRQIRVGVDLLDCVVGQRTTVVARRSIGRRCLAPLRQRERVVPKPTETAGFVSGAHSDTRRHSTTSAT